MQSVFVEASRRTDSTDYGDIGTPFHQRVSPEATYSPPADKADRLPTGKPRAGRDVFTPEQPTCLAETGLTESELEALILKLVLLRGSLSGRNISDRIKLPFLLVEQILWQMTKDRLLGYVESAPLNDYIYQLTDGGREKARRLVEHCAYFGAAPVPLDVYVRSVKAQTIAEQHPTLADLNRAFADLLVPPEILSKLGPAINSARGFLLYGAAGNGKTSIAERVTHAFGDHIWIPRVLSIDGQIIHLFDPQNHEEVPLDETAHSSGSARIDQRWVRIRRPTIIVGGELTMDNLEITFNPSTGVGEAPLQMKSNCGTLVIDDFGRQRMSVEQLLNRWIVPLEKRYDFQSLASGKKIQVPFDQLIIFSTNLPSHDLLHESFLRRIPYKIGVDDPSEEEFRVLLRRMCESLGIPYDAQRIDYLIDTHYKAKDRPFRYCQPRDLLQQIRSYCLFHGVPMELTEENIDFAISSYFNGF